MPYKDPAKKREWDRQNRLENPEKFRVKNRLQTKRRQEWFRGFKKTLKCEQCGENRSPCLDFHHTDPTTKDHGISDIARGRKSQKRVLAEVAKCIVLCANCHRVLHANE